jgi:hypothetical protein|tara:strand:- start:441 stop:614 length:174 start_codon:yes stop_codon:yes gene_type:complete
VELFIKVFASVLASLTLFFLLLSGLFMLPVVYSGELEHWASALGVAGMIWEYSPAQR